MQFSRCSAVTASQQSTRPRYRCTHRSTWSKTESRMVSKSFSQIQTQSGSCGSREPDERPALDGQALGLEPLDPVIVPFPTELVFAGLDVPPHQRHRRVVEGGAEAFPEPRVEVGDFPVASELEVPQVAPAPPQGDAPPGVFHGQPLAQGHGLGQGVLRQVAGGQRVVLDGLGVGQQRADLAELLLDGVGRTAVAVSPVVLLAPDLAQLAGASSSAARYGASRSGTMAVRSIIRDPSRRGHGRFSAARPWLRRSQNKRPVAAAYWNRARMGCPSWLVR